ncbi:MAG TPA: glycosyltransferase family 2 protein [Gemmatimonadales bacterium]|jgi:glycosyltransferase involved in cell wall biosynthesis
MIPISVVIIAKDEERNIGRCLESVRGVADDVVVVDSGSTDRTVEICLAAGARVVKHPFAGHVEQKNWALTQSRHPHVLSLDADEALTPELAESMAAARNDWRFDGYSMNRLTNYCGAWVRHCGWYPDPKLRLFDLRKGAWGGVNPHDHFEITDRSAPLGNLRGDLLHYSYYSVDEHYRQMEYFARIAARELHARGTGASALRPAIAASARFIRNYILRRGFLDGGTGLRVCQVDAWGAARKYALLRELAAGGMSLPGGGDAR